MLEDTTKKANSPKTSFPLRGKRERSGGIRDFKLEIGIYWRFLIWKLEFHPVAITRNQLLLKRRKLCPRR
jgi:hypothetical protein